MNVIDSCWRSNPKWYSKGFGNGALGGKNGAIYVVIDPSDDPVNPKPGTLRYGATRFEPLLIIFGRDMIITLKNELVVNSLSMICKPGKQGMVRSSPTSVEHRFGGDGDGIAVFGSSIVMLIGHQDGFRRDKVIEVAVAFNHFGPGLTCRMPRVRYGYAHVANDKYDPWAEYAIGGSSNPTIMSEGNYFLASNNPSSKQVLNIMHLFTYGEREC
ncbi:OLC1v1020735C1 [Oldenlandia corymbosa var. corymbosa]|uniref:Pectate lyase n=1 Tax=Oldenlandia corymbosa var. corymbosa TaxID=529605 RepID=A0AAV1BU52_OLDCO|nr:OLC1v1020735C1 [Oldenlandia corymbosa var. corymbosa]